MATIAVLGTLDTKGADAAFIRDEIVRRGHRALVVDTGVLGAPATPPDIPRDEVAAAAGRRVADLAAANDRGTAVAAMADGARALVPRLHAEHRIDAVIAIGGGAGTSIGTAAMRALPLGVPKVMVSTLASGDVRGFVGVSDITMMPAVVDVSGVNRISRGVYARAVAAVTAMIDAVGPASAGDKPLVAASMFGNTTPCVEAAKHAIEARGFEVLVFHATGTGGQAMEHLVASGEIAGVLDATTTEWADEVAGGVMAAGPDRLGAAARTGTPAVVAPGCVDMVNFWAPDTVPDRYRGRRFYQHNANVTLMRTTPDENAEIGRRMAERLNASIGRVAVYLPMRGLSVIGAPGGPFHWPEADAALFQALRDRLRTDIPVHEHDTTINDPAFAAAMAQGLLEMLASAAAAARA